MAITVLGFNINSEDKTQIEKIISAFSLGPYLLVDTRTTSLEKLEHDVVISLGKRSALVAKTLSENKGTIHIELPEIKKLYPANKGGDEEAREVLANKLKDLKSAMEKGTLSLVEDRKILNSITEDSLPDLTPAKVQQIEDTIKKMGKTTWTCTTKSGKVVQISIEKNTSTADVNITFAELFALLAAKEIFKISEVRFARPHNNSTDYKDSTD